MDPRRRRRTVLIGGALLVLAAAAAFVLSRSPRTAAPAPPASGGDSPRVEGFHLTDFLGGKKRLSLDAKLAELRDDGGFRMEGIERLEIARDGDTPLVVRAERGTGTGDQGKRVFHLEGGVEMSDEARGLHVSLPGVEIDQAAGSARSLGDVALEGPGYTGTASALVYALEGDAPTELYRVAIRGASGESLTAGTAKLHRSERAIDLTGNVVYALGDERVSCDRATVERDERGRVEGLVAMGGVEGTIVRDGIASAVRGNRVDVRFSPDGKLKRAEVDGAARLQHGADLLSAEKVVADALPGGGLRIEATRDVVWAGRWGGAPGTLRAASVEAVVDAAGAAKSGEAAGGVRFDGKDGAGEADRATFVAEAKEPVVVLVSGSGRRARLASGRTRVVADRIETGAGASRLVADGSVEATLLPDPRGAAGSSAAIFDGREAVHFIAQRLESEGAGSILRFRGAVRGWQGDRNLAAAEVDVDKRNDALDARGSVSTRMPRAAGRAASQADFVQIGADALHYRGEEGVGTYEGDVRARLAEGWIDCARLVVTLARPDGGLAEVRAFDDVRLEFNATGSKGLPETVTGRSDRLAYDPRKRVARLFGDRAPAEVRRTGNEGGTTNGRVLRYALDSGAIEVESASEEGSDR